MPKRNMVPDAVWERQGKLFELGVKHASKIAMELGVSPQTVSREMKRRGFRKNALLHLSATQVERHLAMQARHKAIMDLPETIRRKRAAEANVKALEVMMQTIIKADRDGNICKANDVIETLGEAVGVKLHGKRRKA